MGTKNGKTSDLRIAIPLADGKLSAHFGHCEKFALVDVDTSKKHVVSTSFVDAPVHQPGLLPGWLTNHGASIVIAGGMGSRAQALFSEQGIDVIVGAESEAPNILVGKYLSGTLTTGSNVCDH